MSETVRIDAVDIGQRQRPLDEAKVAALADSIGELGLLQSILLGPGGRLVAGRHRLEACRRLGWEDIPAEVRDLEGLQAELAEIDENFIRADLTELQRAEHLTRRQEIHEALHPATKQGGAPGKAGGGKKAKNDTVSSFAEETAQRIGASKRTVQRLVRIGQKIVPEARAVLQGHEVANNQKELLRLARVEPENQVAVAERVVSGEAKYVGTGAAILRREELAAKGMALLLEPRPESVPLIERRVYCDGGLHWNVDLVNEDPLEYLKWYGGERVTLCEEEKADCLIANPPNLEDEAFTEEWLRLAFACLKDEHHAFIFCPAELVWETEAILRRIGHKPAHRIVWYRNSAFDHSSKERAQAARLFCGTQGFLPSYWVIFHCGALPLVKPGNHHLLWDTWQAHSSNIATAARGRLYEQLVGLMPEDAVILDPFAARGWTADACMERNSERSCVLIEKDPVIYEATRVRLSRCYRDEYERPEGELTSIPGGCRRIARIKPEYVEKCLSEGFGPFHSPKDPDFYGGRNAESMDEYVEMFKQVDPTWTYDGREELRELGCSPVGEVAEALTS